MNKNSKKIDKYNRIEIFEKCAFHKEVICFEGTEKEKIQKDFNFRGIKEEELLKKGLNILFWCEHCNYLAKSFYEFIPQKINNDIKLNVNNEFISVIFQSVVYSFNFPVICKLSNTFEFILNELYKEHPDLREVNLFFNVGGSEINNINMKQTLSELKIKDKDIILVNNVVNE